MSATHWVVRCPNWVGDIVMATPVFECLRSNYPNARLTALIRPYARGIIEHGPWFDQIVDCEDKSLAGLRDMREALSVEPGTAGLLLTNTTHSYLSLRLAGVRTIYGYRRNLRQFFLTDGPHPLQDSQGIKAQPMQDYYLALCRHLGMAVPPEPRPQLYIDENLQATANARLAEFGVAPGELLIGLNPGASFGSSKCWPAENFARLAELLQTRYQCRLILLVGPGEQEIANRIVAASSARIINTGESLLDLALLKPVIKRCNLLITNDTGPRHFAVAFNVPQVVLMGPTNPAYTAAHLDLTRVIRRELPCSPCHKKVCPYQHHACMTGISPEAVMHECEQLLLAGAA